ncbi:MAG TPA: outer membrane protein assembly factor BamA [Acidobacteriaceae bacterium]|nr:outer membrane protein assembly factor BamA [Acidobacteriaceae bacterium]
MSASSLKCSSQPVRTRSSRFGLRCSVLLSLLLLLAAVSAPPLHAQVQARPQFQAAPSTPQILCPTEVIGNRRIPKESILARTYLQPGDVYDPAAVEQTFNALWNTGYFEDVRIERVDEPKCIQLLIYVREKPTIRAINYTGLNSFSVSDALDRFKKEKVSVTVESQFDWTKVKHAEVVLKEMLGEHGHQYAIIRTEIKTIPPASVELTFHIKEGPTVKVGRIAFTGNKNLSSRELRSAMHFSKPIGIPHSIFLENIFPRTFDASKLDEDAELVREDYRQHGYAKANTGDPQTNVRNAGGINPFTLRPSKGKRVDILIPVEEGERYRLGHITFSGNKAITNTRALRAQFPLKDGDWFNGKLFYKGTENLKKAYGSQGYIDFTGVPNPTFDEAHHIINMNIECDEGKQFYISRIEFTGNTLTRDKVIRRELMMEEGQVYNSQAVDLSLLRLNQLNYFDTLKSDQDVETHQNSDAGTVDLLIKLKEKGKNSIGLNGGISGLSGSFIGLNYETNNFLGLGETLSVQANIGDLSRNLSFGFTEPYLRNKPVSLGIQVFDSKLDYNPAKSYAISGQAQNLSNAEQSLLTNYNQSTEGLNVSTSTALRKLFRRSGVARVGLTYGLSRSGITTFNDNTRNVFETLAFRAGIAGQNQLNGIISSVLTPSFSFSTLDRAVGPHRGKDLNAAFQFAGVGGNTKYFAPTISWRQFFPMKGLRVNPEGRNILGYRINFNEVTGFGGEVAPPFARVYGGGENDIRGFDIRSASPYTFIPTRVMLNLTNPDGSLVPTNPSLPTLPNHVEIPLPVYRLASIGGDTNLTTNLEYRIPIVAQVSFNIFTDFGLTFNTQPAQLRQSVLGISALNAPLYGCPHLDLGTGNCIGGTQVNFPLYLKTVPGTNIVPRMSNGAEISFVLPIVNAPFRIFYAYNPLRLYKDIPQATALAGCPSNNDCPAFKALFPFQDAPGASAYTYQQAIQFYGADYILREPRKTFRFTVATTF